MVLFGSRARGTVGQASDVDVAVSPSPALPRAVLTRLREALEESAVPCRGEIVDLRDASPSFRERVVAEGTAWTG